MPELPEVEVVKQSLQNEINNLVVKSVKIHDRNLRYKLKKYDINKIVGLRILKIKRRSKYLIFYFNKNLSMVVHLGMTGKFFLLNRNELRKKTSFYYKIESHDNKHDRVTFFFRNDLKLIYNDIRKFGFIKIFQSKKINNLKFLKTLGPEPLSNNFNLKYFENYLLNKKKTIKDLLMDQKFISGLGNIYVNEILFLSKIKPNRKINRLTNNEIKTITKIIKRVLKKAIFFGGSSIKNFSDSLGQKGMFQQHFNVYGKKGSKCDISSCKGIINKIVISNRASFFCSICQK